MNEPTDTLSIFDTYRQCSGMTPQFDMGIHYQIEVWLLRFTEDDLKLVIAWLHRKIKAKERRITSLRYNLIFDVSRFNGDLSEAKAESRKPITTNRGRVLAATGRAKVMPDAVKTPAQMFQESEKLSAMLKAWRTKEL